jgi:hypothetical protein
MKISVKKLSINGKFEGKFVSSINKAPSNEDILVCESEGIDKHILDQSTRWR